MRALVLGDYPPVHGKPPADWAARVEAAYADFTSWEEVYAADSDLYASREDFEMGKERAYSMTGDGSIIRKRYAKELPRKLQREAEEIDLAPALAAVAGPVLILKGEDELGSALREEELAAYAPCRPNVVRVRGAGHNVVDPLPRVREALTAFFAGLA